MILLIFLVLLTPDTISNNINEYKSILNEINTELDQSKASLTTISKKIEEIKIEIHKKIEITDNLKRIKNLNEKISNDSKEFSENYVKHQLKKVIHNINVSNYSLINLNSNKELKSSDFFEKIVARVYPKYNPTSIPKNNDQNWKLKGNKAIATFRMDHITQGTQILFNSILNPKCLPNKINLTFINKGKIINEIINLNYENLMEIPLNFNIKFRILEISLENTHNFEEICIPDFQIIGEKYIKI